jgi:hypothetical protein
MSIWAADLGSDPSWPDWFVDYRAATDAELQAMIAALQQGDVSEAEFTGWVLDDADRHVRWLDSLPPDRRAWIEAHEAADRPALLPQTLH